MKRRKLVLVPGTNGNYAASIDGRIINTRTGREVARGNTYVAIGRKRITKRRIIMEAFGKTPPSPRHVVVTKDGDGSNLRLSNLEWRPRNLATPNGKLSPSDVKKIRDRVNGGVRVAEVAHEFGVTRAAIYSILNGTTWSRV